MTGPRLRWHDDVARWLPPAHPHRCYSVAAAIAAMEGARSAGVPVPMAAQGLPEAQWHQLRAVARGRCEATAAAIRVGLSAVGSDAGRLLHYLGHVDGDGTRAHLAAGWLANLHPPIGNSPAHVAAAVAHTRGPVVCLRCTSRARAQQPRPLRLAAADASIAVTLQTGPWPRAVPVEVVVRPTSIGAEVRATVSESFLLPSGWQLQIGLCDHAGQEAAIRAAPAQWESGQAVAAGYLSPQLAGIWATWHQP